MRSIKPFYMFLAGLFLLALTVISFYIPLTPQTRFLAQLSTVQTVVLFLIAASMIVIGIVKMVLDRKRNKKR